MGEAVLKDVFGQRVAGCSLAARLAAAMFASALGLMSAGAQSPAARPNFVFVLLDDAGFSDIGAYGGEIATPNIDELARTGVRMTNFHTASTCEASRSMLHSGVDSHLAGAGTLQVVVADSQKGKPGYEGYLSDKVHSLGRLMKDGGYATYFSGKWNLGDGLARAPGAYGWERYIGLEQTGADNFEAKVYAPFNMEPVWWQDGERFRPPKDFFSTTYYVDRLMKYIEDGRPGGKPFFGVLSLQAVHSPLQAPEALIAKYEGRYAAGWDVIRQERYRRQVDMGLFPSGLTLRNAFGSRRWDALTPDDKRQNARRMAVFAAMLDHTDSEIGRLRAYLRRIGQEQNTVFIVMSDNGADAFDLASVNPVFRLWYRTLYSLAEQDMGRRGSYVHYGQDWAQVSNTPFYHFKGTASEGGMRVPFIISYPQRLPAATSNAFAWATDFLPTMLDLAGIPLPGSGDAGKRLHAPSGASMVAHLEGKTARIHPPDRVFGYESTGSRAVFRGDYKFVRDFDLGRPIQWRLFNLAADPLENDDLAAREPERVASLMAEMKRFDAENGIIEPEPGYDPLKQLLKNNYPVLLRQLAPILGPPLLLLLLIPVGLFVWWRRRRRRARTA